MSKKGRGASRRPRNVITEVCPVCERPAGLGCVDYRRRGCAPHAVNDAPKIDLPPRDQRTSLAQGELFPGVDDATEKGPVKHG